ncbi:ABC transporter substrate-binding protein [Candidatus Uhrbacteria bacterium]|nr:ABC transporter substrate-binding protein [Candidatus Uhrbacteria bacterium]
MKPITDAVGQQILVAKPPQRVVCLAPYVADASVLLGATPCIVGMSDECAQPTNTSAIPYVGRTREPNMAMIRSLDPDLVIAATDATPERALADLIQLHKPVFHVHANTVQDGLALVDNLGAILWRNRAATSIQREIEEAIMHAGQWGFAHQPRVLCITWEEPMCLAGRKSYAHDLIQIAGGINIAPMSARSQVEIDHDVLRDLKADVILLQDYPDRLGQNHVESIFVHVGCQATLDGRVHLVSGRNMIYPGPRTAAALNTLIKLFHP